MRSSLDKDVLRAGEPRTGTPGGPARWFDGNGWIQSVRHSRGSTEDPRSKPEPCRSAGDMCICKIVPRTAGTNFG